MDDGKGSEQKSPWMTAEETAAYLSVAVGTIRNWTSMRFIPFARRGRVVRYHIDQVDAWLATKGCPGRMGIPDFAQGEE